MGEVVLTSSASLGPISTKAAMIDAFKAVIGRGTSGDKVIITFSGHGTFVPDLSGDEVDGLDEAVEAFKAVGREFGAILNLDELLTRIANLTRRVIDYRTFGILLVNEATNELEMKLALKYLLWLPIANRHLLFLMPLVLWSILCLKS